MKLKSVLAAGILFMSMTANAVDIIIYEAGGINPISGLGNSKGKLVLINGEKAGNPWKRLTMSEDSIHADKSLRLVSDFFTKESGRKSYDGRGSKIEAVTRVGRGFIDLLGFRQNAAWDGTKFLFGDGEKDGLTGLTDAIDVIAHEYTHAIVQTSTKIDRNGQSGALNEHLADVFGQYAQVKTGRGQKDFLIGETLMSPEMRAAATKRLGFKPLGMRDMLNPGKSFDPQPAEMKQIPKELGPNCKPSLLENDLCGAHLLSGIPNRAISLTIQKLGWDKVAHVLYVVMTERLPKNPSFADYASETISECGRQLSSSECAAFDEGFKAVGL